MRLRGITESGFQRISQTLDLEDSEGEVLDGAEDELEEKPEDLTGGLEPVRVFHGTSLSNATEIQEDGLKASPNMGYDSPQWYMVAEDFASAAHHSESTDPVRVVIEFLVPTEDKELEGGQVRSMWEGYPYLWPPQDIQWEGSPTRWWALKQPLDKNFIEKVHRV